MLLFMVFSPAALWLPESMIKRREKKKAKLQMHEISQGGSVGGENGDGK